MQGFGFLHDDQFTRINDSLVEEPVKAIYASEKYMMVLTNRNQVLGYGHNTFGSDVGTSMKEKWTVLVDDVNGLGESDVWDCMMTGGMYHAMIIFRKLHN
jgi:hypothetical protein